MSDDAFFAGLRSDWQSAPPDAEAIARGFARYRRWKRMILAASIGGTGLVAAAFIYMAWCAIAAQDAAFAVAALALAAALVPLIADLAMLRTRFLARYDATPFGLLQQARDRNAVLRRSMRGALWAALVLVLAALALLAIALLGSVSLRAVALPALLWLATAAIITVWRRRREQTLGEEQVRLDTLIASFDAAG